MSDRSEQGSSLSSRQALEAQLIVKAAKDETFRQELMADPRGTVERELGVAIPAGIELQVHEETPTVLHLVLPAAPTSGGGELSDAELEQVAGGKAPSTTQFGTACVDEGCGSTYECY